MEILEAYDLTGSFRDAAELARCSHHTVAAHVAARDAGGLDDRPAIRPQLIDAYLGKVEEWVEQSAGKIRADKAHCSVARHRRAAPGSPKITEEHFPPAPAGALERRPGAKNAADVEFLALGGARTCG